MKLKAFLLKVVAPGAMFALVVGALIGPPPYFCSDLQQESVRSAIMQAMQDVIERNPGRHHGFIGFGEERRAPVYVLRPFPGYWNYQLIVNYHDGTKSEWFAFFYCNGGVEFSLLNDRQT